GVVVSVAVGMRVVWSRVGDVATESGWRGVGYLLPPPWGKARAMLHKLSLRRGLRLPGLGDDAFHHLLGQRVIAGLRLRIDLLGIGQAFRRLHERLVQRRGEVDAANP